MLSRVSIVIVNWKTPELLADCLQSIVADPRSTTFETWVVDNDSQDGSVEMIAQRFPWVKLVANSSNVGFARACNQVIPLATAPYVLLLNPDTLVRDSAISKLADFMDGNVDCAAAGPRVLNPDGSLQLACRRSFPSPAASFYRLTYLSKLFPKHPAIARYNLTYADPLKQLDVDALSGSCMMVRKTVIDKLGLMDEDIFMFGEDIDWCWRFKQDGWRVSYVPEAVVYHYHGAASRLRPIGATINLHKGMEVFYRKHMAGRHSPLFNALVYGAIWFRAGLFIVLSTILSFLRKQKVVAVLPNDTGDSRAPAQAPVDSTSSIVVSDNRQATGQR
jgi:N-acetylglucosaminyl-diphospho-decaprenol L-rhamnosyltransferase